MSAAHAHRRARRAGRGRAGMTLLEIMVATFVLSMVTLMIFSAFSHTALARRRLGGRLERDHLARNALNRIGRDLRGAYLSAHTNVNPTYLSVVTAFLGRDGSGSDRLDLTTFTHRRLVRHAHEGDACEVGYRVETRRGDAGVSDLLRRESRRIDVDPFRGGVVDVLVPDVVTLQLRYFDTSADAWTDSWDTTDPQKGRLPGRVRVELTLRDPDGTPRRYMTETAPMIQDVLRFGLPIDYH